MSLPEQVDELSRLLVASTDREVNRDDTDPTLVLWAMILAQMAKEQSA